jgi:hypothetical protein
LKYIVESKVATSGELMAFKRDDPQGFDTLILWAREEMTHNGIEVTEPAAK